MCPRISTRPEVVSLVFTYMTAYQVLHRVARVMRGESVLVHGAAGRVGTAVLELGALAGLRLYGTCSAPDRAAVERLGAVAIDYRNEDFLARARELPGKGLDVVLDGLGGPLSLRSFRALRPGGRLVVFGAYSTLVNGHKSRRAWIEWYAATATVAVWGLLSPSRRVLPYRIQKLRNNRRQVLPVSGRARPLPVGGGPRYPEWFREDFGVLLELLRQGEIHPVVAERLPLADARRAHEMLESAAAKGKLVLGP
jgi:NADPH:quinone reductase-like Zn-dependent oxidoreductase